jgi:short-subunit dehydrogenase
MLEQGAGTIVNVASVNAFFQPNAGTIDYGAAKAALVNLTKTLARGVRAVVMLASDRLGNVTGSNYVIDGGLIKTV